MRVQRAYWVPRNTKRHGGHLVTVHAAGTVRIAIRSIELNKPDGKGKRLPKNQSDTHDGRRALVRSRDNLAGALGDIVGDIFSAVEDRDRVAGRRAYLCSLSQL